jgi:hypothetical protein
MSSLGTPAEAGFAVRRTGFAEGPGRRRIRFGALGTAISTRCEPNGFDTAGLFADELLNTVMSGSEQGSYAR